jgi:hypothetical protein
MADRSSPEEQVRRLYEEAETATARAAERLVSSKSFGELLAMMTENVVALTRIGNETFDLLLRNLRLASRRDVIELGRQLSRTEDKLERVLQEVETVHDRVAAGDRAAADGGVPAKNERSDSATTRRPSGQRAT